jgi:hypothetical protein
VVPPPRGTLVPWIVFDNAGYLFSAGERGAHLWIRKTLPATTEIYRLNADGSIPKDNPFVGVANAKEAIYTYGNRNRKEWLSIHRCDLGNMNMDRRVVTNQYCKKRAN